MEYKDRHPLSVSDGQKQRVAIASAISPDRKIMLFDEQTSGLGYWHMEEVAGVLRQFWEADISLHIIIQDIELIAEYYTDIIHLEDGVI